MAAQGPSSTLFHKEQIESRMRSRTGLALAAISLTTTGLGMLGQLLLFHYFGAGRLLDLYFYSLATPSFIAGQIGLVFSYYLVPYLLRQPTEAERTALARGLILGLTLLNSTLALPGIVLSAWFAPRDFSGTGMAWLLSALAWSSVMLANINGVQGALLNCRSRFITSSLLALLPQAGAVAMLAATGGTHIGWALAGLNLGSLTAMWIARTPRPSSTTASRSLIASLRSAAQFTKQASVVPLALSIFSAHFFVDALLNAHLPEGDLSILALAHRVLIGGIGIVVAAFGNPITTALAQAADEPKQAAALLGGYLKRILVFGFAVSAVVLAYAPELSSLLLAGRADSQQTIQSLAAVMRILAVAALPMLMGQILMRALMAWHRQQACLLGAACWLAIYLPCAFFLSGKYGANGLALTYLMSWCVLCVVALMQAGVQRQLRWRQTAQMLGHALGLAAICIGVRVMLTPLLPSSTGSLTTQAIVVGTGALIASAWAIVIDRLMRLSAIR